LPTTTTVVHCVSCGTGSDSAAVVSAIAAGAAAILTLLVAVATWRSAGATRKAAQATEKATKATVTSAAATEESARATHRAADAAVEEASAALREAEATARMVDLNRQQMMPVVMPLADPRSMVEAESLPKMVENGTLVLPVANVGAGPAFGIRADFEFLDQLGKPSVAPQPFQDLAATSPVLGAGRSVALRARFRGLAEPILPFRVSLSFVDSSSLLYESSAVYFPAEQAYRFIVFRSPTDRPEPSVPEPPST
jgi:hypothetical protein